MGRWSLRAALLAALVLSVPVASSAATSAPFGHACTARNGVRFCPATSLGQRVASFDGTPIDVDVTLPQSGDGPFPTLLMLHGYGGKKTDFETDSPAPVDSAGRPKSVLYHYNNVFYAQQGYAVVTPTVRGFDKSCGTADSRTPDCGKGYIHLMDQRYEVRDVQTLLGYLADQNLVDPQRIGATGISYGGGESLELAYLKNRVRLPDGSFAPWKSPNGTSMGITAAFPRWPWSDLADSLLRNGRFLDFRPERSSASRAPVGVPIQSYVGGLFLLGQLRGSYASPGSDPSADIVNWNTRFNAGEPFGPDARAILDELHTYHGAAGLDGRPAPLLLESGWTDDLFPPAQSLRIYNRERALDARAPVSLFLGDLGHSRGSNKLDEEQTFNDAANRFLNTRILGARGGPRPGSVTAFRQTCPLAAPTGRPFAASSWARLHPGIQFFGGTRTQVVTSDGGNAGTAQAFNPVPSLDACKTVGDETAPGTAVYRTKVKRAFTLLGLPTVGATIRTLGPNGQIDSRLWDVGPDGQQTLITRGVLRLKDNQRGRVLFQLDGNGWRFERGHTIKLELTGRDAPRVRASNGSFSVRIGKLVIELPTAEGPKAVIDPLARQRLSAVVRPARVSASPRRRRFVVSAVVSAAGGVLPAGRVTLPGARVAFGGHTLRTGRRGTATFVVALPRRGTYFVAVRARGFPTARTRLSVR